MTPISAASYEIVFNDAGYKTLNKLLSSSTYTGIYLIVDTNTHEHCLASFLGNLESQIPIEVIEITPGEINKNIATCTGVWDTLVELNADRKAVIINLGGGVVTDLGGFVASTFKRGMDFINVPTSLLAMVDASVGGKTGVDLGSLKNLIGIINNPKLVLIDGAFMATLPKNELRSGLAEMYKHGLITDKNYWNRLKDLSALSTDDLNTLIYESIVIKNTIVLKDPTEQNIRKKLNYGHTLGHAIESFCLDHDEKRTLLHGEAIAIGMILETFISMKIRGLDRKDFLEVCTVFTDIYNHVTFSHNDIEQIIMNLKYDKKNTNGDINFVLLETIGKAVIDQKVSNSIIHDAFDFYATLAK